MAFFNRLLSRYETFWIALAGGLLLWLAFPPAGIAPLAWVAPLPWLWLVRSEKLTGRRPYRQIYAAGFLHWLLLVAWLRLPHWTTACFGWPALSLYLAFYLPTFIALARVAVWRLRVPLVVAAPLVWVGLELARGHLLTGFSLLLVGHTQVDSLRLIQISDLGGAYTVSLLVMLVAACLAMFLPVRGAWWKAGRTAWLRPAGSLALAAAAVGASLVYGERRLEEPLPVETQKPPRIALVQGSIDTIFGDGRVKEEEVLDHYGVVSMQAAIDLAPVDLYVWPESMYPLPYLTQTPDATTPPESGKSPEEYEKWRTEMTKAFHYVAGRLAGGLLKAPLLVGARRIHRTADTTYDYNAALLLTPEGQVAAGYDKMHPVMFGEYVPLGHLAPIVYRLTPLAGGLNAGRRPVAMSVDGWILSPNICFESTVPHLIRRQVLELEQAGTPPDALVNLTNDGWFWGSAELDAHLHCSVFRAIECRRPVLVAANTGFSAWIDGNGRIVEQGPRHETGYLLAQPVRDGRPSLYLRWGDWLSGACLAFCLVVAALGLLQGWRQRQGRKLAMAEV